jgi:hypothetical protein
MHLMMSEVLAGGSLCSCMQAKVPGKAQIKNWLAGWRDGLARVLL